MTPCPKCGHLSNPPGATECARCGVIFARFLQRQQRTQDAVPREPESSLAMAPDTESPSAGPKAWLTLLVYVPDRVNPVNFWGRAAAWMLLVVWSLVFLRTSWERGDIMDSFLHQANLVFHEAGHVVFAPLGRFMMFLGGSLMQCLVPLTCTVAFLLKRNPFAASACAWWLGQNLLDLAPYVGDARLMSLPLIGEWSDEAIDARSQRHDWHNILAMLGWLKQDQALAQSLAVAGWIIMVLALAWGGYVLWRQHSCRADVVDET